MVFTHKHFVKLYSVKMTDLVRLCKRQRTAIDVMAIRHEGGNSFGDPILPERANVFSRSLPEDSLCRGMRQPALANGPCSSHVKALGVGKAAGAEVIERRYHTAKQGIW